MGKISRKCENLRKPRNGCMLVAKKISQFKNIKKDTFIYSSHFIGDCGPTEEDPDPLLATLADKELRKKATRKRKPLKQ